MMYSVHTNTNAKTPYEAAFLQALKSGHFPELFWSSFSYWFRSENTDVIILPNFWGDNFWGGRDDSSGQFGRLSHNTRWSRPDIGTDQGSTPDFSSDSWGGGEPGLNLSEPPAGTTECRPLHQWICEAVLRITVISWAKYWCQHTRHAHSHDNNMLTFSRYNLLIHVFNLLWVTNTWNFPCFQETQASPVERRYFPKAKRHFPSNTQLHAS